LLDVGTLFFVLCMVNPLSHISTELGRMAVLGGSEDHTGASYFSAMASAKLGAVMEIRRPWLERRKWYNERAKPADRSDVEEHEEPQTLETFRSGIELTGGNSEH
jgi:hypothetical protein